MTSFVLVHGMAHGGWCWEGIESRLVGAGHEVLAPDLPLTSLTDDAAAVAQLLDSIDGPTVLVGHSYGGLVISAAAAGRTDVGHLVYVAAAMVAADELMTDRVGDFPETALSNAIAFTDDGMIEINDPDGAMAAFYGSCEPAVAAASAERLRPTAAVCVMTPTGAEPWHDIASTYVLCNQDEAIHPAYQRTMASRASAVVEIDTDHSPFLSTPDRLTEVLLACI